MLSRLMCLAVPVQIVSVTESERGQMGRTGVVDFNRNRTTVSLALVPAAQMGDWVLVHAGMALQVVNEAEAKETWRWLAECGLIETPDAETTSP